MQEWFDLICRTVQEYGIANEDIYNFDETRFMMGVISTAKVVTSAERAGRPFFTQPGNREWVTVIECITSQGWVTPPIVIFEGKINQMNWYTDIPNDWMIAVSDNGWTNNKLGLIWLKDIFEKHTHTRMKGRYRLLILDGHKSHVSPEFEKYCLEHLIITLCMLAHSSHLCQPLEEGCFAILKRSYGQQVAASIRLSINHVDKQEFLSLFQPTRIEAMSSSNI